MNRKNAFLPVSAALAFAALGPGCQDADDGASTRAPDDAAATPALYAVQYSVPTPDGQGYAMYVNLIGSLDPQELDPKKGLEYPGGGFLSATKHLPTALFIADAMAPTVTRFDIRPDGGLTKGTTISFMNQELEVAPRLQANMIYASATKVFAIDKETAQVIVWDPTAMAILKVIPIPGLEREGYLRWDAIASYLREDGKAFIPTPWHNFAQGMTRGESAIVVIDTNTDAVETLIESRCGGLRAILPARSGDLLVSGSAGAHAVLNRLYPTQGTEPCIVRIRKDQGTPDPTFIVRGADLGLGGAIADASPAGNHVVFEALDEDKAKVTMTTTPGELIGAEAWPFYAVPLAALGSKDTKPTRLPLAVGRIVSLRYVVDGRSFIQVSQTSGRSTLIDVSDPTSPRESLRDIVKSCGSARDRAAILRRFSLLLAGLLSCSTASLTGAG